MIVAALDVAGLGPGEAEAFAALLGPLPGRKLRWHSAPGLALAQLVRGPERWQPGRSASGRLALFNGQLHNRLAIAAELGVAADDCASIYAAALDRWETQADERLIGHYCAIAVEPGGRALRLARSPIEAPPLHFRAHRGGVIAASLPRPLFWRDPEPRRVNLDRLADSLLVDFSDRFAGNYSGSQRMPQGSAVILDAAGWREVWRYDLLTRPKVSMADPRDYVAAARDLLDQGVAATMDGAQRPGVLLSSGLDSPSVAASALAQRATVFGFTYGPKESWQEPLAAPGNYNSEFPGVAEFAAMHPRLKLETFTNPGRDFRYAQRELIQAMDFGTPSVGLCWPHHAIHQRAAELGCDVLLTPNWGNETFSANAPWALPEWFARGHWRRLIADLQAEPADRRPLWRKVLAKAVMPWLPSAAWRSAYRLWHGAAPDPLAASALRPEVVARRGMLDAMRRAHHEPGRNQFATRRRWWSVILAEDGQDREAYSQGMEVLYGVPLRDPAAYRPLVEFCFGLPTELFRREGRDRWLAREMARGRLPETLRTRRDIGMHHPDWHARLAPVQAALSEALERAAADEDVAALLDLPRLRRLLAELPGLDPGDWAAQLPYVTALPIGLAAAQFIAYAKGRNDY